MKRRFEMARKLVYLFLVFALFFSACDAAPAPAGSALTANNSGSSLKWAGTPWQGQDEFRGNRIISVEGNEAVISYSSVRGRKVSVRLSTTGYEFIKEGKELKVELVAHQMQDELLGLGFGKEAYYIDGKNRLIIPDLAPQSFDEFVADDYTKISKALNGIGETLDNLYPDLVPRDIHFGNFNFNPKLGKWVCIDLEAEYVWLNLFTNDPDILSYRYIYQFELNDELVKYWVYFGQNKWPNNVKPVVWVEADETALNRAYERLSTSQEFKSSGGSFVATPVAAIAANTTDSVTSPTFHQVSSTSGGRKVVVTTTFGDTWEVYLPAGADANFENLVQAGVQFPQGDNLAVTERILANVAKYAKYGFKAVLVAGAVAGVVFEGLDLANLIDDLEIGAITSVIPVQNDDLIKKLAMNGWETTPMFRIYRGDVEATIAQLNTRNDLWGDGGCALRVLDDAGKKYVPFITPFFDWGVYATGVTVCTDDQTAPNEVVYLTPGGDVLSASKASGTWQITDPVLYVIKFKGAQGNEAILQIQLRLTVEDGHLMEHHEPYGLWLDGQKIK